MKVQREPVTVQRAVRVERIPDGTPMDVPAGTVAQLTQALGSSFTLLVDGQLVRLKGADADAIGRSRPVAPEVPADVGPDELSDLVWQTLRTCYDPEIPIDIVELGLVYDVDLTPLDDGRFKVKVQMTLTAPGCGMGEGIADEVCDKVLALPHVGEATVDLVFDPPWDRYRLSEVARLALGL
ncbi:MAG: putative Fe-S cluster assembly protein SufT [Rubrivivax sp.]